MKSFRLVFVIYITAAFLVVFWGRITPIFAESAGEKNRVCINWAFGALTGAENNRKLISIKKDTSLKTGDQFKMMVELKSTCFVYLIYHGSNNEIQLLFPNDLSQLNKKHKLSEKQYIPQGDLWFALDENTGKETFYLLVSKKRLADLENLLKVYESSIIDKKADNTTVIIKQIKKIKKQHKKLTATVERPVLIGGTVRGLKDMGFPSHDIANLAVEISADGFYSRTFTIEHK